MATEKEKIARWSFLDSLLSQGRFISQMEIIEAYHQNPDIRIEPRSIRETPTSIYLPSLRKDLNIFKDKLDELGKRDLWEEVRSETDRRSLLYRYKEPGFSIIPHLTGGMTDAEYRTLAKAVSKLEGMVNHAAYEELRFAILSRVESDYQKGPIFVDYEDNRRLKGREYRPLFYRAMTEKQVLHIYYKTFKGDELEYDFHPYLLKQYNERWFAFGWSEPYGPYTSVPLDRLEMQPTANGHYAENRPERYLEDYFDIRVGVSNNLGTTGKQRIELSVHSIDAWGRMITKPLPTQEVIAEFKDETHPGIVSLDVIPNKELMSKILSLGDDVVVEDTKDGHEFHEIFVELINKISRQYIEKEVMTKSNRPL